MLRESDAPLIAIAGDDPETQKWLPLPTPYTLDDAKRFIDEIAPATLEAGTGIVFAIEHENEFVGCIDVKRTEWLNGNCEIGYWTMPEQRGRGFMSQALELLSEWVLVEQHFVRVEVRVAVENHASKRIAEKASFVREGIARQAGRVHSGRVDLVIYSKVFGDLSK
jgi:RimJ/RimL family protein N-acetyltransferase